MDEREQRKVWLSSENPDGLPFHLDDKVPARYVSFQVLRNLIARIGQYQSLTYAEIVDRPVEAVKDILVTDDGQTMGRSTRYHHLNALKILGLVNQQREGYILSSSGAAISHFHSGDDSASLSPESQRLFRVVIRSCDLVRRNFFVLFTGDPERDPWTQGAQVSVRPIPGQRTYELTCPKWPGRLQLSREQTQGIMWGLRQWCQAIGLVDEIFIRPQADVESEQANIIFPVDSEIAEKMTIEDFDETLRQYLPLGRPAYGDTVAISIPLLFYRLCPAERLPLQTAKTLLKQWLAQNPEHAFVEAPSYSVLEAGRFRRAASREVWRKQQDTFLRVGDSLYSRLFVSQALWSVKGEYSHARQ